VIASQGSFYVGGEKKALPAPPPGGRGGFGGGDVTVNQMYVRYMVPQGGERNLPVVMVHGATLTGVSADPESTRWCLCLYETPMPPASAIGRARCAVRATMPPERP